MVISVKEDKCVCVLFPRFTYFKLKMRSCSWIILVVHVNSAIKEACQSTYCVFLFPEGVRIDRKMAHFDKLDETHPYYAIAAARMWQKPETKQVTVARFYWKFAAFNFIHKR